VPDLSVFHVRAVGQVGQWVDIAEEVKDDFSVPFIEEVKLVQETNAECKKRIRRGDRESDPVHSRYPSRSLNSS
jgi:hypothetical protein